MSEPEALEMIAKSLENGLDSIAMALLFGFMIQVMFRD